MLVSRISRRVLAEHHIALTKAFNYGHDGKPTPLHVGIIHTGLNVKRSIERCSGILRSRPCDIDHDFLPEQSTAEWSDVIIDGHLDTTFAYIREHLEYIVFELLKNIKSPEDLLSFSHIRNATRLEDERLGVLRTISTSSRGIKATVDEQVDNWQHEAEVQQSSSTPEQHAGANAHPRIGIGLPMSNIFATYFGGSLELVSMDGYGTDVYLRLPRLGTNLEGIEV
ncbi:hypothetical protein NLI96_g5576 [Meripilus lineatus]|uniref:Protein-serine/threonine kinase n=1 Tax=Meripilus lineatus TaxID=2056292 RepID=A0AAD5V2M9_9APHY|nr:hypothetical protein NLI96_g5576 [Physisporinus lineatus]